MCVLSLFVGGYSEENLLMMRAKINFFGKEVGEHPNIIHLLGAVIDSDACRLNIHVSF
jgi:hypothetical protein